MSYFRLLTFNIRYIPSPSPPPPSSFPPFTSPPTELPWSTRLPLITSELAFTQPHFALFQECLHTQTTSLASSLTSYNHPIGVGRDDGKEKGEAELVFVKKGSGFNVKEQETFWLSHEPFKAGSKFPGAGSVRTATWVTGEMGEGDRKRKVVICCTHWDEQSEEQRRLAASLILWRTRHALSAESVSAIIVAGDFNSTAPGACGDEDGHSSGGYKILTGLEKLEEVAKEFKERFPKGSEGADKAMGDLGEEAEKKGARSGHRATFTGFKGRSEDRSRIDFVMGIGDVEVERFRVGENWWDSDGTLSDHRPVYADLIFGKQS